MTARAPQLAGQPIEENVDIAEARDSLGDLVKRVARGDLRVVLKDGDQRMAALVSAHDFERLTRLEATRLRDLSALEASQAAFEDVSKDELEAQIATAIAEVRAEGRRHGRKRSEPA